MPRRLRIIVAIAVPVLAVGLVAVVVALALVTDCVSDLIPRGGWGRVQFSSGAWVRARDEPSMHNARCAMLESLLRHGLSVGMTRRQVEAALGAPDYGWPVAGPGP